MTNARDPAIRCHGNGIQTVAVGRNTLLFPAAGQDDPQRSEWRNRGIVGDLADVTDRPPQTKCVAQRPLQRGELVVLIVVHPRDACLLQSSCQLCPAQCPQGKGRHQPNQGCQRRQRKEDPPALTHQLPPFFLAHHHGLLQDPGPFLGGAESCIVLSLLALERQLRRLAGLVSAI